MLQAAALAEAAGAPDNLVAAALLHDVGHFRAS
jgi:gamma-butyrobetaine dioxygenase